MPAPMTTAQLAKLQGDLASAYTVRFNHDGSWEVILSGAIVHRGSQTECRRYMKDRPTAALQWEDGAQVAWEDAAIVVFE